MLSQRGVARPGAYVGRYPRGGKAGQRQPAQWHRCQMAGAGCGQALLPSAQHRQESARYPVLGATLQRRGGVARHDAVAWGYARGADARGVDIIENCRGDRDPHRGERSCRRGRDDARHDLRRQGPGDLRRRARSSVLAAMARVRLPLQDRPLQALVSGAGKAGARLRRDVEHGACLCQPIGEGRTGDRGQVSTRSTPMPSAASFHIIEAQMAAAAELFPIFSRLKMLRSWAGIVDVSPDASPIIGKLDRRALHEWRLGDRRVQGDPRRRPCLRAHHRQRCAAPLGGTVRARPLHDGRPRRRAWPPPQLAH